MHTRPLLTDFATPAEALSEMCTAVGVSDETLESGAAVTAAELPWAFGELLAHHGHMTPKLTAFHGGPVSLDVLTHVQEGAVYSRQVVLQASGNGAVVEFGIVRLSLAVVSDEVRAAIVERKSPLGDILNRYDVLTRVEPKWFLRFEPSGLLAECFNGMAGEALYGRIGIIYFHEQPAVELLEIVTDRRATDGIRADGKAR